MLRLALPASSVLAKPSAQNDSLSVPRTFRPVTARSANAERDAEAVSLTYEALTREQVTTSRLASREDGPVLRDSGELDELERLRNLGIPLKAPYVPPRELTSASPADFLILSENELTGETTTARTPQSTPEQVKPTPPRLTPGVVVRQRAQALSKSSSSRSRVILSEARKKKELERMMLESNRDMAGAAEKASPPQGQKPFWRKKKDPEGLRSRQMTKRVMELKRRRQLPQIIALLEEAKAKGKALNLITMNAALSACEHCGDIEQALDLFEEMTAPGGCGADCFTYGALLKGLGRARRLDDAFELLESMEAGTAPGRPELTEVHLNTLVNACADAGDARRARSVLQRFRAYGAGLGPSVLTYNLLIKGYARSDNPLEALKVVEEMHLQGLPLERVSYNSLLVACIRGGDLERALELLQEMKAEAWRQRDARLWPDSVSYTTMLKGMAEDGDLEGVLALVREMKHGAKSLEGAAAGDTSRRAFLDEVQRVCQLDRVSYTAIVDACLAVGSTADALVFLKEMEELAQANPAIRPRAHVFLSLMRAMAPRGELQEIRKLKDRMARDAGGRVWPDDLWQADELVLEAAVLSGKIPEAEAHFLEMHSRAPSTSTSSFSQRGIEAVVRLSVASLLPGQQLQPIALKPQVVPRSAVEVIMRPLGETYTLPEVCRREDVEAVFDAGQEAVPILSKSMECVGVLTEDHLDNPETFFEGGNGSLILSALQAPPSISRYAPIGDAASLMVSKRAQLLTVVQGDSRVESGIARGAKPPRTESTVVGFLFHETLF